MCFVFVHQLNTGFINHKKMKKWKPKLTKTKYFGKIMKPQTKHVYGQKTEDFA